MRRAARSRRNGGAHASRRGVALLMVVTAIAILSIVVIEFSSNARTHLDQGVNIRDEARASTLADTAMVLTRACLDPAAWSMFAQMMDRLDLEKQCNLLLGIFVRGRVDLPIGGLSVEMEGVQGVGIAAGEIDDIKLTTEDAFIGLAGLRCASRADLNCATRLTTAAHLRSLLCAPEIAHVFEKEQEDGQRYTRDEIIGNLVDWIDADDNRIHVTPALTFEEGAGENEDAYYGRMTDRYKVKDSPFDSIEELRLVRGINDALYEYLRPRVSVYASSKVDVNQASVEVMAALLWGAWPAAQIAQEQGDVCGKEDKTIDNQFVAQWAKAIVDARNAIPILNPNRLLAKPFKNAAEFMRVAQDPLGTLMPLYTMTSGGQMTPEMLAVQYFGQLAPYYTAAQQGQIFQWPQLQQSVATGSTLYRLQASGTVGNMTRRVLAILQRESTKVRTLYYREE